MTWILKPIKDGGVVLVCVISLVGGTVDAVKQANDMSHENDFGSFALQVTSTATTAWNGNVEMGQNLNTGDTFDIPRPAAEHKSGLFVTDVSSGAWFRSS